MFGLLGASIFKKQSYNQYEYQPRDKVNVRELQAYAREFYLPRTTQHEWQVESSDSNMPYIRLVCRKQGAIHLRPGARLTFSLDERNKLLSAELTAIQFCGWERRVPYKHSASDKFYDPEWEPYRIGHNLDKELYKSIALEGFEILLADVVRRLPVKIVEIYRDDEDDKNPCRNRWDRLLQWTATFRQLTKQEQSDPEWQHSRRI